MVRAPLPSMPGAEIAGDLPVADTDIAGHGLIGKDKGSSVDYQIEVAH